MVYHAKQVAAHALRLGASWMRLEIIISEEVGASDESRSTTIRAPSKILNASALLTVVQYQIRLVTRRAPTIH